MAAEIRTSDQSGELREKAGEVRYQATGGTEVTAGLPQILRYGDILRTFRHARATVLFADGDEMRLDALTELRIIRKSSTNAAGARISQGNVYVVHRSGPTTTSIETPQISAIPRGTEFSVSVDPVRGETVFTMMDGEVVLRRGDESRPVRSGEQGIVAEGRAIEVRPVLQASNLVQWWIHYPGILDPLDLNLPDTPAFRDSVAAYQRGNLRQAFSLIGPGEKAALLKDATTYQAALLLGMGSIHEAEALLQGLDPDRPGQRALRTLLDALAPPMSSNHWRAVTGRPALSGSASELLALSYAHQATNNLRGAREMARQATIVSPNFGFGWARLAELEFGHGQIRSANQAIVRSLELAPENAESHAVQGFLQAARNELAQARSSFERAIQLDSGAANGWLGRGLIRIHQGQDREGREDLAMATALEPSRSLLRSYAAKAFLDGGQENQARQELRLATTLDPNDPTPWFYLALFDWQHHRLNASVGNLEKSIALNDQRALFRSRLLLDQDRAVRGANLASIYHAAGLSTVAMNEAARAVAADPANYSAHLFLSQGFNRLRDPARFNLRYESPWFGEYLLATLLSPVGATPLSQNISQQEYSRLFSQDRASLSSDTLLRSDGEIHEIASHFGSLGRTAWALDLDYQHNDGVRRNHQLDRTEWYTTLKHQLTHQDSALLLLKYQDYASGDQFQYFNPKRSLDADYHFEETQHPISLAGYHREWAPGVHSLILAGRLENEQRLTDGNVPYPLLARRGAQVFVPGSPRYDVTYRSAFEAWTAEFNQRFQTMSQTLNLGARVQAGEFTGRNQLTPEVQDPLQVPFAEAFTEPASRLTGYGYHHWHATENLVLISGLAYDELTYPRQLRSAPVARGREDKGLLSPKAGLVWTPTDSVTVRAAYTRSLGGVTLDQSYRLEPTHLAGFAQTYRTLLPISLTGPVSAQEFTTYGAALDWKLPARTYLSLQVEQLESEANHALGVLQTDISGSPTPIQAGGAREHLQFHEQSAELTLARLYGEEWSAGLRYRFAHAELGTSTPEIPVSQYAPAELRDSSDLHSGSLFLHYNHSRGFFAQTEFTWQAQENSRRMFTGGSLQTRNLPSDLFPQWNLAAGWRFPGHRGDVTLGILNVTGDNYRLSPVNFYNDMPHERVFFTRLRFQF